MIICTEMQKIRDWLDQNSIPWEDYSDDTPEGFDHDLWICRTRFMADDYIVSVINGAGSYGGYSFGDENNNQGLLEAMSDIFGPEPIGYLTAEELIKLLQDKCHMEEIAKGVNDDIAITLMNAIAEDK